MVFTGSLVVTIASVRIQRPASAATELFAVVRCGKQQHTIPNIRDNSTWNKSLTFSLKDESETEDVIFEVLTVANEFLGSARIPLSKAIESKMGASMYSLAKPDQASCGEINVALQFLSYAQPPRGYPQRKNGPQEIENAGNCDEKLASTESKERGLHSSYYPGSYTSAHGHYDGHYPGHGLEYYGNAYEHSGYGHGHSSYGHGHGHGHHGHEVGPPFYPSHSHHGYNHNHHHHHC